MDFSKLKDVNNVKALAKEIGGAIVSGFKDIKTVNKEVFMNAFNKYFVSYLKTDYKKFDGRVSRRQYWMFALFSSLVGFALSLLVAILPFLAILSLIYVFAIIIPSIGLGVRRLHDINLSGWFFLIALVPFVGGIALYILFLFPSDKEANNFGPAEK